MHRTIIFIIAAAVWLVSNPTVFAKTATQLPQPAPSRVLFSELAAQCAPNVHHSTLQAISRVESGFNPYAIGVVKGALPRQPKNLAEAVFAARSLHQAGKNFSMGLMQINRHNLKKYGLTYETVFDVCRNLSAAAAILTDCFNRSGSLNQPQTALQKALSCYYSGNFRFGFSRDFAGQPSYVQKVMRSARANQANQTVHIPAIDANAAVMVPVKNRSAKPKTDAVSNQSSVDHPVTVQRKAADWDVFADF